MDWIDCKDRLPENTNDVLVIDENGLMAVSCYFFAKNEYLWENRDDQIRLGNVTYWMPLPNPPNELDKVLQKEYDDMVNSMWMPTPKSLEVPSDK